MEVLSPGKRHNYHECNKTALPGLGAVQVYVVMNHAGPCMSQQNLCLVSNVLTCGIPFQTAVHELHVFLEALRHRCAADGPAFSTFLQFFHPSPPIRHMWACLVLLQGEIIICIC